MYSNEPGFWFSGFAHCHSAEAVLAENPMANVVTATIMAARMADGRVIAWGLRRWGREAGMGLFKPITTDVLIGV